MSADPGRRARYLEALGIDTWVPRGAPPAARRDAVAQPRSGMPPELPSVGIQAGVTDRPTGSSMPVAARQPDAATEPGGRAPAALAGRLPGLAETTTPPALPGASPVPLEVATDWDGLRAQVLACTRCGLHRGRTQAVFASGDPAARWMVVGEAPGADEDRQGEPFVGRAGQLLNAMLAAIGLPRPTVFVANMIKCRPPQNRDPRPEELAACRPYLERQFELLRPTLVLVVGRIAAQNLLGTDAPLGRLRGQVHRAGGLNLPVVVTYHPAYLLRSPADKRKAWEDLKLARRVFGELASQAAS